MTLNELIERAHQAWVNFKGSRHQSRMGELRRVPCGISSEDSLASGVSTSRTRLCASLATRSSRLMTAAAFYSIAKILSDRYIENGRIVTFREMGSEGGILEIAEPGGTLGIREPRERFDIARDGSWRQRET